jgi:mRNA-degrading endonuclease RelE of RelBE toxin-antitoxin system
MKIKEIIQSPVFARKKQKLQKNQLIALDKAIRTIAENPSIGAMKTGDLQGIQIYKFKSLNTQILLAYELTENKIYLYAFGSHQNFYKALRKYLK